MNDGLRCDAMPECPPGALYDCDFVFGEPVVLPVREGGSMVQWTLDPRVRDKGTYRFTLQVGQAGSDDPLAWTDVVSRPEVCFLVDPVRRLPGVFPFTHYRLRLETGERCYFSRPLHTMGRLRYEEWRVAVSVMRAEYVQLARKSGIEGFLFKRKISGRPCPRCRDFNTNEVTDGGCRHCYGTGWVGGYYEPVSCCWFDVHPADASIRLDYQTQGPVTNTRFQARAIASPLLICGDLWLNRQNSERYRIVQIQPLVEQNGVPVVYMPAMERLPYSDIAYSIPCDDRHP